MSDTLAVFRVDATPEIGLGHLSRCMALAELLDELGWQCAFAVSPASAVAASALSRRWTLQILPADPLAEAAALARRWPGGCALLAIDHYSRDAALERQCRPWAKRILVIDDLADRAHEADLLLDPTPGRMAADYAALVSGGCQVLAGLPYALLRRQFAALRAPALMRRRQAYEAQRLMISVGGTDAGNLTARVLDAAASLYLDIDVVLGAMAPHLDAIRARTLRDSRIQLYAGVETPALLMGAADLAVGAAGVSAWERCCLGLPSLVVVAADNQRPGAQYLAEREAALVVDEGASPDPARIAVLLQLLVIDRDLRQAMTEKSAALCDGRGGWRTLLALQGSVTARSGAVSLRLAEAEDAPMMFDLQVAPETRRYARRPVPPTLDEHTAWFGAVLTDQRRILTAICRDGVPVGVLRLDRGATAEYEVSIAVSPDCHGQGIGAAALTLAQGLMPGVRLLADIDAANLASTRLFQGAGFQRVDARHLAWRGVANAPALRAQAG